MKEIIIEALCSIEDVVRLPNEQIERCDCVNMLSSKFIQKFNLSQKTYTASNFVKDIDISQKYHIKVKEVTKNNCYLVNFVYAPETAPSMNDIIKRFFRHIVKSEEVLNRAISTEIKSVYEIFVSANKCAWESGKYNEKISSEMDKLRLKSGRKFTSKEIRELLGNKELLINGKTLPNREYMCELHNFAGESSKYQFVCFEVV